MRENPDQKNSVFGHFSRSAVSADYIRRKIRERAKHMSAESDTDISDYAFSLKYFSLFYYFIV